MKRTSTTTIILFLFIAVLSCTEKSQCDSPELPYQVLSDSIKSWLPYTADTDIIFENNNLQNDTIRLRDYFNGDDEIWRGDECSPGNGQFRRCNFIDPISNDTIKTEIGRQYIFMTSRKTTFVIYNDDAKGVGLPTTYRKFEKTVTLNSKQYNNCIWVECVSSDNCNPMGITKYYFAKDKGLVAYVRNNILWTLK